MVKKPNLADSLKKASEPPKPVKTKTTDEFEQSSSNKFEVPPSRVGKKAIAGHFDPAVSKQLKQIALEEDSTVQRLLEEALNDLFSKHGKPPIA